MIPYQRRNRKYENQVKTKTSRARTTVTESNSDTYVETQGAKLASECDRGRESEEFAQIVRLAGKLRDTITDGRKDRFRTFHVVYTRASHTSEGHTIG